MYLLYRVLIHNLDISKKPIEKSEPKSERKCETIMMKKAVKKQETQMLDLTTIEGEGSFPCPGCGTTISPDDETEEVYKIVDTKVVGDELAELVICCDTCGTVIKLTGFQQIMEEA